MEGERKSTPGGDDPLEDSWFDRPGRKLRLPALPSDPDSTGDPDAPEELDDPWFVWTPEV